MEFHAKIVKEEDAFIVSFPDFPNINTYGDSFAEAQENAHEALNAALESDFERGYEIPKPTVANGKRLHFPIQVLPHIQLAYELKKIRRGSSQSDIARKLGISYQAYQKLENPRKCNPTVKTLERIGEVYGKELRITFR